MGPFWKDSGFLCLQSCCSESSNTDFTLVRWSRSCKLCLWFSDGPWISWKNDDDICSIAQLKNIFFGVFNNQRSRLLLTKQDLPPSLNWTATESDLEKFETALRLTGSSRSGLLVPGKEDSKWETMESEARYCDWLHRCGAPCLGVTAVCLQTAFGRHDFNAPPLACLWHCQQHVQQQLPLPRQQPSLCPSGPPGRRIIISLSTNEMWLHKVNLKAGSDSAGVSRRPRWVKGPVRVKNKTTN